MAWYVAQTHPRAEDRALRHLENQGFTTYLPRYRKVRRHARRTDLVRAPLFPRYLFVWMDVTRVRWRSILSTVGVRHLICHSDGPVEVPGRIIEELREREDADGLIPLARQSPLHKGERIKITRGSLIDQIGVFDCCSDTERVYVLLSFLGREVRIQVPLDAVAKHA